MSVRSTASVSIVNGEAADIDQTLMQQLRNRTSKSASETLRTKKFNRDFKRSNVSEMNDD